MKVKMRLLMSSTFKHIFDNNYILLKKLYYYDKKLFMFRILFAFNNSLASVCNVLFPKYLLISIIAGNSKQIITVGITFGILFLFYKSVHILLSYYDEVYSQKINVKIINEILIKTLELDLDFFDKTDSYNIYHRAFTNCCNIVNTSSQTMVNLLTSVIQFFMLFMILIWIDFWILIIIILSILASFVINNYIKKLNFNFAKKISEREKQLNYIYRLFYIPQFIREFKVNNLKDFILNKKQIFNNNMISHTKKHSKSKAKLGGLLEYKDIIENIMVSLYFGFSVLKEEILISDYFTSVNAYQQMKNSILNILSSYTLLYSNSLFADDYLNFLNADEVKTTNDCGKPLRAVDISSIEFKKVNFKYPNDERMVLKNLSFKIHKGNKIAFIGENGAGKTTIIKLLLRLYDPIDGEILINDTNLKEYNTIDLRNALQVLFQDYTIYAFSIKENIAFEKNIDDDSILEALERVGLKEKILNLHNTIYTTISSQLYESGIELSGGESQRIALSRIYANKPTVFIMDEPTSNLDPYAEYQLYNNLVNSNDIETTSIVVSHRLTLTYKMDKIFVLKDGSIAEQGSHHDLLELGGLYKNMYQIQSEKYVSD